jgi:hypothetical protein
MPIRSTPHRRVGGEPAGGIRATANGANDQFVDIHWCTRSIPHLFERLLDPRLAVGNRLARTAGVLNADQFHGTTGLSNRFDELAIVEPFATERDQQYGSDVGMRAKTFHHLVGVGVRKTPGKANKVHALFPEVVHDLARYVVRALDQVTDDDGVANAFTPVGAQISIDHGCYSSRN